MGAQKDSTRINERIDVEKIRLVDQNGNMVGVVTVEEGLKKARFAGLDLVEVSPNADPPVCKILDYGKFKYEDQKRKAAAKKKQKTIDVKEIKIRPTIEENDYQVKLKHAIKFLEHGDKVKVSMRFRGREIAHKEIGLDLLKRMCDDLEELSKVEQQPKSEGRSIQMLLGPK